MPASFEVTQSYSFEGNTGVDLWTPLRPSTKGEGGGLNYGAVLRLHDGVDWNQARSELLGLSSQAFSLWKIKEDVVLTLGAVPMQEGMTAEVKRPLMMLWGGVGIVLLIACVNIAGLLLARGTTAHARDRNATGAWQRTCGGDAPTARRERDARRARRRVAGSPSAGARWRR